MNILFVSALVIFALIFIWVYILFITNSINEKAKKEEKKTTEVVYKNPLERCETLFEQGLHEELQRYAQKELSKNYGNIELRRILAKSLMASGNEQMAIAHYEAILAVASFDIETQELLARYYCENGPKTRAIELYEQILLFDRGSIVAAENLAKLYDETRNYQKSIEMYKVLLDAQVEEKEILELKYIIADLYSKTSQFDKAFEAYKEIHSLESENLEILILLADLAYKNKYWVDCLSYYQKIISIVGEDFEILEKIAQLQVTLQYHKDAIETYTKIISLEDSSSPNYLYHQNELCNEMLKEGLYKEAIDRLKDLLIKNPKETSFAFSLASAYTLIGDFSVGVNLYKKLLEDLPIDQSEIIIKYISNLICSWALDLFKKGDYNQAFDKFFEALKYNEENDEVYYQLGVCNYYIKSFQDSIAHFKRAIAIKPQDSRYYYGLGCAYDELELVKNAKMAFYDAINIDPSNISARIAYALSLTKELEYAQSIEQFSIILETNPNDADTTYNLALAYDLVGDIERAIKYYRKALEVDSNHKEAINNLNLLIGEEEPIS